LEYNINTLEDLFTKARIDSYRGDAAQTILDKYHLNIQLSEAMLPALSYLEVCLRNRLDQTIKIFFGSDWLITPHARLISLKDQTKIKEIYTRIKREKHTNPGHDDILAQMTFGFWCTFFHKKYDPLIWHKKNALRNVFPNLARNNRKRSYVEQRILLVKELRNRIAHHEPILSKPIKILQSYQITIELLQAISLEAYNMLKTIDRFAEVYKSATNYFIENNAV
jgi:hypothetical protein